MVAGSMTADINALRRRVAELEDRVQELEDALGMSIEVPAAFCKRQGKRHYSRRNVWRLVCGLARRGALTHDQALIVLYGDRDPDDRPKSDILNTIVWQARRWLSAYDIEIDNNWGVGWSFNPQNRARAKALIEQYQAGTVPS